MKQGGGGAGTPGETRVPEAAGGWRRVALAFGYTRDGLAWALRHEAAVRQEFVLGAALLPAALLLPAAPAMRALLVFTIFFVITVELLNTAVEAAVDRFGPEYHELSKLAKDLGSAAVFTACVGSGAVWALAIWDAVIGA